MADSETKDVYALIDPRSRQIRYVGVTSVGIQARMRGHLSDARLKKGSHVRNWIKGLLRLGMKPSCMILERSVNNWQDRESHWISILPNLTNITTGGDGTPGLSHSVETRTKMRSRMLGNKIATVGWSEKSKAMLREKKKGIPLHPSTRAGFIKWQTGRPRNPETKEKIRKYMIEYHSNRRTKSGDA